MKSILHEKDGTCYLCKKLGIYNGRWGYTEEHHVFAGTANRKLSEKYGLKVHLCIGHHREGPCAVHKNPEIAEIVKQDAQRAFEQSHSRGEFLQLFGKNHLYEDDGSEEPEDLMTAGMEAAAENEGAEERAAGSLPPGIRLLREEELNRMGDPYLHIRKEDAACGLNDRQFKNLTEIMEELSGKRRMG